MQNKNNVVIIGGGYGGLMTALKLRKNLGKDFEIYVIDQRDHQLFSFNLYELATTDDEMVSVPQAKASISLPIAQVISGKNINFIQSPVKEINTHSQTVQLHGRQISYHTLVVATGSVSDTYGIKGVENYTLPLKTLEDAMRIRSRLEMVFQAHTLDFSKKLLRFVVAGGGYTGCELAAELVKLKNFLCWKYEYPYQKVEILIVEAAPKLINGFSKRLSDDAYERLKDLGVRVMLSSSIFEVTQQYVELVSREKIAYDLAMWTCGIKPTPVNSIPAMPADAKGRILVNEFLQVQGLHDVYALGDAAKVLSPNGHPVPSSAQDALDQAGFLAKALPLILKNQKVGAYQPLKHGFIVSLGGKWAIMDYNGIYLKGFLGYIVRQLANLEYAAHLLGWWKAVWFVWFEIKMFGRND